MNVTITPGRLAGTVAAIPSKSHAHRAMICAAFARGNTKIHIDAVNADIESTARCLISLGADIRRFDRGYDITPAHTIPEYALLDCGESGSTLRFLLPVAGALGVDTTFQLSGRLPMRPLSPLWEEMERMGCTLTRPTVDTIRCTGKLRSGEYTIAGNVSSQFITGLLFAGALMEGDTTIHVTGKLESEPYVIMTRDVMAQFGLITDGLSVRGRLTSPGDMTVEGDWSNAAFFLTATALGSSVTVTGLNMDSSQGDRAVVQHLNDLKRHCTINAADIPDLIPILSVMAAASMGAEFTNIQRLRLKESDRVEAIIHMLTALGGRAEASEHTLTVYGTGLRGGTVDSRNDHRIAMAAAIAGTVCQEDVTILGAEAVNKSYPSFWEAYRYLGGKYEQYLR